MATMQASASRTASVAPSVLPILNELSEEAAATRRLLERVPNDKLGWKPHAKSRTLGELANHIASIPLMAERVATTDEFNAPAPPQPVPTTVQEIRDNFQKNLQRAEQALSELSEQKAHGDWRLVFRGKEVFKLARVAILRKTVLNHTYHHRGQLGVYLRLLEVPVPVVYGPTADENPFS
ncbi:MAG TPA: DinB family protein [Terriglobales bacterium]|nr:DinB family protein [Terriglobales bacterium]